MRQLKILVIDLLLITAATLISLALRDNLVLTWISITALAPYLTITLVTAAIVLPLTGISRTMWRFSGLNEYGRLVFSCASIVMISVLVGFAALRMENVPRSVPVIQGIIMIVLMVGVRVAMRARRLQRGGSEIAADERVSQDTVIVVGLNTIAELFIQAVAENQDQKIAIAGVIGRNERHTGHLFRGQPVLGTPEDIPQVLRNLDVHGVTVDRIVVAIAFDKLSESARQSLLDIENGSQIKIDYFAERLGFAQPPMSEVQKTAGTSPDFNFRSDGEARDLIQATNRSYWWFKRRIDWVLAALTLLAFTPLMFAIGMMNAAVHGTPVLFWQQRPGLHGRPFKVYKFRSLLGAHDELGQRLPDDLRETWFGRFLRATRLDELPQFVNIFNGHMSFIGPRPLLENDQLKQFSGRLLVRPGLTGWAQVNGGKSLSASDKMALDIWYIRNASFALDLKIALLTVHMMVFGERENQKAVDQALLDLRTKRVH